MSTLTASTFQILLERLERDPEKYENLRLKIAHMLRWRGCSESHVDELADRTLDRVAAKLATGEQVDNINAFAAAVARFIWLEHSRRDRVEAVGDELPEVAIEPDIETADGPDQGLRCLRRCVATKFSDDDRRLVISYYDADPGEKAKAARRRLADSLGMTMNALKVRACRLRGRLEACINDCMAGVTQTAPSNTSKQELA